MSGSRVGWGRDRGSLQFEAIKLLSLYFFFLYYIVSKLINNLFTFTAIPAQALTNTGLDWHIARITIEITSIILW